jgi:hypothetical protein
MSFECYSQRMLNPFRGSMNCVRHHGADAVTADGVHWDIYVSNDRLMDGLTGPGRAQVSDIRFGSWSADKGLRRGPIHPSEDFRRMERLGQRVYAHLLEVHEQVPFPFMDRCELWLLDSAARPLALLDSALYPDWLDHRQSLKWLAGQSSRRSFTSAMTSQLGIDTTLAGASADYLGKYINDCAGPVPAAQIFQRQDDGSGNGLAGINLDAGLVHRTLAGTDFPTALLDCTHHDETHRQLIEDFIRWQAPWQLLLPALDTETRRSFEQHARVQPFKLAQQYRLYPRIIDRAVIDAARVEARIRQTHAVRKETEPVQSTFYIELSPDHAVY